MIEFTSFRISDVIRKSLRTIRQRLGVVLGLSLVIQLPLFVMLWLHEPFASPEEADVQAIFALSVATVLVSLFGSAAIAHAVFEHLRGRRVGIAASLWLTVRRSVSILAAALLIGATMGVVIVLTGIFAAMVSLTSTTVSVALMSAGMGAAIAIYCGYFVAIPALIAERVSPIAALRRSSMLTEDRRLQIFGLLLLIALGNFALVTADAGFSESSVGAALRQAPVWDGAFGEVAGIVLHWLTRAVTSMVVAVIAAVCYHDLLAFKEGLEEPDLAAIFD